MAKGNDGNYLQHGCEVAVAVELARTDPERRLHVCFAHGMAPFEQCEQAKPGQARSLISQALNDSFLDDGKPNEAPIVAAYRKARATFSRYPNSAELMRHAIGVNKLSGAITERDSDKYNELVEAWRNSQIQTRNASWRSELNSGGVLACPERLETPWLFTLDPMSYREGGEEDDNNLHRADLDRLSTVLGPFVKSEKPGIAAIFVYNVNVKLGHDSMLWRFADDLANSKSAAMMSSWVTHQGGNRNLAALLSWGFVLESRVLPPGVKHGRE